MAKPVICHHLTAESQVLPHAVPCGFYDRQSATGTDNMWLFRYYPPNIITLILLMHLYIDYQFYVILAMTVFYIHNKNRAFHSDLL